MNPLLNVSILRERKLSPLRAEILWLLSREPSTNSGMAKRVGNQFRQTVFQNIRSLANEGLIRRGAENKYFITAKGSRLLDKLRAA